MTLKHPYTTAAGVRVDTLTLRQPTVADLRRAKKQAGEDYEERTHLIIAACCGLIPEDLDGMDLWDYQDLAGAISARSRVTI